MLTNENIGIAKNLVAMLEKIMVLKDNQNDSALIEVKTNVHGDVISAKFKPVVWLAISQIHNILPSEGGTDLQKEYSARPDPRVMALDAFKDWFEPIQEICACLP